MFVRNISIDLFQHLLVHFIIYDKYYKKPFFFGTITSINKVVLRVLLMSFIHGWTSLNRCINVWFALVFEVLAFKKELFVFKKMVRASTAIASKHTQFETIHLCQRV